jgi:hypothetical protein
VIPPFPRIPIDPPPVAAVGGLGAIEGEAMSEYQYVAFRAIDGPVSEKNLEVMRRQSSRAEITPWSFDNEYHFGDFHGNAVEMLRRGYDLHLHYANFGIRKLMLRLPNGLPDPEAARAYFDGEGLRFVKDKQGPAGILSVEPFHEPGDLDELWNIDELLTRLAPLRAEILDGDLRPLYLANLAVACDGNHDPEETKEGPVPAGLDKVSHAQRALAQLYEIEDLIAAAARNNPPLPAQHDAPNRYAEWLQQQPEATRNAWLARLMAGDPGTVRREMLAEFHKSSHTPSWPTVRLDRTIAELEAAADEIRRGAQQRAAEKAARQRARRLADMAADPTPTVQETEKLAAYRSTEAYDQIATLLADLREALTGTEQSGLAEQQARKLKSRNPTRHFLTAALRRKGFLGK